MDQSEIDRLTKGGAKAAKAPDLSELPAAGTARAGASVLPGSLDTLLDVSLPVAIEFGRTHMTVQEVLELGSGSVIQLDRMVGEPIDIYISDRKLAEGEVVVIGEHFGVRITRILAGNEPVFAGRSE
jgi:flagellar motor switch protein FliN/FliY